MQPPIRLFTSEDYQQYNALSNTLYPDYAITVEETKFLDQHRGPEGGYERWVLEDNHTIIASCEFSQFSRSEPSRGYGVNIMVHPAYQGRGIGTYMCNHLFAALQPLQPIALKNRVREDMLPGLRLLQKCGFVEEKRNWESILTVANFRRADFAAIEQVVRAQDIEIVPVTALEDDEQRDEQLYALYCELSRDIPGGEQSTLMSYYAFMNYAMHGALALPDAFFLALHHGDYIGMSFLQASQGDSALYTGLTGVKRAYRRGGIALALKVHAAVYAQSHSYTHIRTWNDSTNLSMLTVNERLGFVKQQAWVHFVKRLA